jgi:hypothetical protein
MLWQMIKERAANEYQKQIIFMKDEVAVITIEESVMLGLLDIFKPVKTFYISNKREL